MKYCQTFSLRPFLANSSRRMASASRRASRRSRVIAPRQRTPRPGPGLGVRCLGAITRDRLHALREADAILREEFDNAGLAGKVWQYFIAVPDVKSVGVRNEMRYEGWPAIIRAVNTTDAMTATIEEIPYALLHKITDRITHEVEGINRVLYDLTPKPIGTIEWE